MRFSAFSLFALSSLFVGAFAAPTSIESREVAIAEVVRRDAALAAPIEERGKAEIVVIVEALYTEVFSLTKSINITISSCGETDISVTEKVTIIAGIQVVIGKIIAAFSACCLKIWKLPTIQLPSIDFKLLIGLVVEIFIECIFTFLNACKVLKCSILELLGGTLALFLNAYITFLVAIGKCAIGFLVEIKLAFAAHLILIGKVFTNFGYLLSCL